MMKATLFISLFLLSAIAHADQVWVVVKKSVVRENATYLSSVVAKIKYQDSLDLLSEQGDWWQVQIGDAQGWVHKSALSKTFKVSDKQETDEEESAGGSFLSGFFNNKSSNSSSQEYEKQSLTSGDADDITLAGKGFNKNVEGQFKEQGDASNYAAVDRMENREVPDYDFQKFADDGGLVYVTEQAKSEGSFGGFFQ